MTPITPTKSISEEEAMLAYHGNDEIKKAAVSKITAHAEADEIVKGIYWENGRGCAIGCQIESGNHMEYENRFGIPVMLARLEDTVFEGLPNVSAKEWPLRFMGAIKPGQDLSLVGWKFLHWLLTDEKATPGINHLLVRDAIKQCADVIYPLTQGEKVDASAARSAESAARSAESAAWSAGSAESAARSAAWSAGSAESAARSAARSAESAESAARSAAWSAERSAAYKLMADKLIELIEQAPMAEAA